MCMRLSNIMAFSLQKKIRCNGMGIVKKKNTEFTSENSNFVKNMAGYMFNFIFHLTFWLTTPSLASLSHTFPSVQCKHVL